MNPRTDVLCVVRLVTTCRPNAAQIGCAARGSREPLILAFGSSSVEVLVHVATQHGIDWARLGQDEVSRIVAETHVEQRTALAAAKDTGLITSDECERCQQFDIASLLRSMSDHALSTDDYLKKAGSEADWLGRRSTTIPSRQLYLPVPYIKAVVEAYSEGTISGSRAAEFLMIDEFDFADRFGDQPTPFEEE